MRARCFFIAQDEYHPETGKLLLSEDRIKLALNHKSIKLWAYIYHDKDVYTAADELENPKHKQGTKKAKHWHIAISTPNAVEVSVIAKWFGIPENFIKITKGAGAFLDCVEYLTHEDENQQALGKALYLDDEVKANFNWREKLDKRAANKAKYGRDLSEKDQLRQDVLLHGMTLKQCCEYNSVLYANDLDTLKKLRGQYLSSMKPPATRINFYVCGDGGQGKGLTCRALARSLFSDMNDDYDIFFETGAKGAPFEGYDGQPVIIWNDRRAIDLLDELGSRGNVFNVFDTHPSKQKQNIKYSSIGLINSVNIVNSVQPYEEFLNGLAGEYTDKNGHAIKSEMSQRSQSYRRFPLIIALHQKDLDILINRGFLDGETYEEYMFYQSVIGNLGRIRALCGDDETTIRQVENKVMKPIVEGYSIVLDNINTGTATGDLSELEHYGESVEILDLRKDKGNGQAS